jgi:hypothetical protein
MRSLLISLTFSFLATGSIGQISSFSGISIQGQFPNEPGALVDLEFYVIGTSDTIWHEVHTSVQLTDVGTYSVALGQGSYLSGSTIFFDNINWVDVVLVEMWRTEGSAPVLVGSFMSQSMAYAFHSLSNAELLSSSDLTDGLSPGPSHVIRWTGADFVTEEEWTGDTAQYAWSSGSAMFADTVGAAFLNTTYADSAINVYYADTADFSPEIFNALHSDTTNYADSTGIVQYSPGNWSISGNSGLSIFNFVGTTVSQDFNLATNNTKRFLLQDNYGAGNVPTPLGFRIDGNSRGVLFQPANFPALSYGPDSYLYFSGSKKAFSGGRNSINLDTALGQYSFAWGKETSTNGMYSVVFGHNNFGDSAFVVGVMYDAIGGFSSGRNNKVSYVCVAIGDSCVANYYRNVAIGRKVIANKGSSSIGIGNNILSEGATAWAMGKNLQATGHFSTALGTNASTNLRLGSFVYGDASTTDTVRNTANHQFMVRAAGGYVFWTTSDTTMGVKLDPGGGSWASISDRTKKKNIEVLHYQNYRDEFIKLPVYEWNYAGQDDMHIGPMAQDLFGIFAVGESERLINMVDYNGITFLGIKLLNERIKDEDPQQEILKLRTAIEKERQEIERLKERILMLYEETNH